MVSVLNGSAFMALCHMISMISAKRSQTTLLHVFDVARVECEVYLMEATQNLGEQDLRLDLLQLQFVVGAFPRPTRLIPHLC
jgi:hypothetical protein